MLIDVGKPVRQDRPALASIVIVAYMHSAENGREMPAALSLLASERPRNVSWIQAGALLFGDWGTSRLYVLGLAFLVAGGASFWLVSAMSLLILAVAWAYTQICRIYADGGGVYTAARHRSKILGVVGALLLFADYTVTASLSALDGFHYFGVGGHATQVQQEPPADDSIVLPHERPAQKAAHAALPWHQRPAVWAMVVILLIGAFNLLGPKHTAGFALFAAVAMIAITLLIVIAAIPQIPWSTLTLSSLNGPSHTPVRLWQAFVAIVLALSGVEAIANLTGVMKQPVHQTARRSIWMVAGEVAIFNLVLGLAMVAMSGLPRAAHKEDMLAYMAYYYLGPWGEWPVRLVAGLLLLSATNTAIGAIMGTLYVMSRDGELPAFFQRLNGFGTPWIAAVVAAVVPAAVLLFANEIETLADLYAIGIVGAVTISTSVCAFHPRLRKWWRKAPMLAIGILLLAVWMTLAWTKWHAVVFVAIIMAAGLTLRALTQYHQRRHPRPSLLRRAIMEQLSPEALAKPKLMLATAGSALLARRALQRAKESDAALVVCFIRELSLSPLAGGDQRLNLDNDDAAEELFTEFLELGHQEGVPIIPMYDTGPDSSVLIAELAAINGVNKVLIGSSRRGPFYRLVKGSFQRKLEKLLPSEIGVEVLPVR